MATIRVRSTTGNNANDGSTWALAKATLAGAFAIAVAGDTIYVSQAHAESTAGSVAMTSAGTIDNLIKVVCVNDSNDTPTAVAASATVTTTGASSSLALNGSVYVFGIGFTSGSGASTGATLFLHNVVTVSSQVFDLCSFTVAATGSSSVINVGYASSNVMSWTLMRNCTLKLNSVNSLNGVMVRHPLIMEGCSFASGTLTPAAGVFELSRSGNLVASGCDFSTLSSTVHILKVIPNVADVDIRNCKLPDSWTGSLMASAPGNRGANVRMHNCDSADSSGRFWEEDYLGSTKNDLAVYCSGEWPDGVAPFSIKISTSSTVNYPGNVYRSPELPAIWNDVVGTPITLRFEVVTEGGANLTDAEVWVDAQYLGTSGRPLALFKDDSKASVLATATDQPSSSSTWTGLTSPNASYVSVTFTAQEAGFIHSRLMVAKTSATLWVCPKPQVT